MTRRLAPALALAAAALAAAGCSSSTPAAAPPAGTANVTTQPAVTSTPADTPTMTNDGLTGFAASWDTWNATRTPDGDSAMHEGNDSGYDPDPALPVTSLTAHDHYSAVGGTGTYVTGYHVNFHAHTSIATAQADVLTGEFPPDAKWLWQRAVPGQCYLAEVKSATLAKDEKAAGLGDSSGDAFAEFQTDPPGAQAATYNPKNVTFAAVSWGTYPVTPEDAVGC